MTFDKLKLLTGFEVTLVIVTSCPAVNEFDAVYVITPPEVVTPVIVAVRLVWLKVSVLPVMSKVAACTGLGGPTMTVTRESKSATRVPSDVARQPRLIICPPPLAPSLLSTPYRP